jgi:hypothetical protein
MKRLIVSWLFMFWSVQFAVSAPLHTVLDNNKVSSGVNISEGGWSAGTVADPVNADATYNAFRQFKGVPLGKYDFYYSLEIVPQFNMSYSKCSSTATAQNFLNNLFGASKAAIIVVSAQVYYRWTTGISVPFVLNPGGLVAAGLGTSGTAPAPAAAPAASGYGCYFSATMRPTFPLLQYGGGGQNDNYDDFVVEFSVTGGTVEKLNGVANVVSLFSGLSAAAQWTSITSGLTSPASQAIQNGANTLQTAVQNAGTVQNQVAVGEKLKANNGPNDKNPDGSPNADGTSKARLVISIPDLFSDGGGGDGNLVIYIRRAGSIALTVPDATIYPRTIFDNVELPNRLCNPSSLASGNCGTTTNDPLRVALAKILTTVDSGIGSTASANNNFNGINPVQNLIDVNDKNRLPVRIYNICQGLRTVARDELHTSTLDEMMIRWAATKEGGLQDMLKKANALPLSWPQPLPLPKPPGTAATWDAWATQMGAASLKDLADACWNDGDEKTVEAVVKALGKTLAQ